MNIMILYIIQKRNFEFNSRITGALAEIQRGLNLMEFKYNKTLYPPEPHFGRFVFVWDLLAVNTNSKVRVCMYVRVYQV